MTAANTEVVMDNSQNIVKRSYIMGKIIVSVEATADIPESLAAEYGIAVVPMEFIVDGQPQRTDDPDVMPLKAFYDGMREGKLTQTSQVNREEALSHLEQILKNGDEVIQVSFSSALSGTCANFLSAAEELDRIYPGKVKVVDSLAACSGQALMAVLTAKYAATGKTLNEVYDYCADLVQKLNHIFIVDNLKYLARGGRISKATALLGNAIQLKPVMRCNEEGKLVPFKKVLARNRSITCQVEEVCKKFSGEYPDMYISHADCLAEAEQVRDRIHEKLGIDPIVMDLGPVIGSHSGPGTIAVFFVGKDRII